VLVFWLIFHNNIERLRKIGTRDWIMFALEAVAPPLLIRSEERELRSRYGAEFMGYMRRVPQFFPQIR
jgi:protein-S-isoprenylcysteine O-methyltransferase Ste14